MYPALDAQELQLTMTHQPHGVSAVFLLMLLTMFSSFRFAEALASVAEEHRGMWTVGAGVIAGYCRFSVQLCFLSLFQIPQGTSFDLLLFVLALLVTIAGRTIVFRNIIREDVRLRRLLPSSLLEAATILSSQWLLLGASHLRYTLRPFKFVVTFFLIAVVCFLLQFVVLILLRQTAKPWRGRHFVSPIASIVTAAVVTGLLWMWIRNAPSLQPIFLQAPTAQLPPLVVPFAIGIAVLLLCGAQAALFLYWRSIRWSRGLAKAEHEKEIAKALAEQRAMRMQNETLLEEIRERKRAESKLAAFAFSDPVTGLHNRSYLNDRLRTLLQRKGSARAHAYHALLYIDLDNFKSANDMLGHAQGDALLKEVAKRLRKLTREEDVLVRIGGDEFAILLNRASDSASALRFAHQFLTALERPLEIAGNSFYLSASIGLCSIDANYADPDLVLRDADLAMYSAKREGGARVAVFVQEMYTNMLRAIEDRKELKRAIEEEEFVLWYQPLVDMQDGSIYGSEALIRWQHPVRGLLGPYTFIRLAEETGHIIEIGNWVLRKACGEFHKFQERASRPLLLSLNVSSKQLELPGYFDLLVRTLEETGMPPNQLQLEITESILMSEPALMGPLLQRVRALGIKIAFDDFGTGYSSLSYIQKFPVDTLKIDQSFVRSLIDSPVNGKIIQLILGMSDALGMNVSVEGVETEFEANTLLRFGCRIAQGFLYSKPVEKEIFFSLLKTNNLLPHQTARQPAA